MGEVNKWGEPPWNSANFRLLESTYEHASHEFYDASVTSTMKSMKDRRVSAALKRFEFFMLFMPFMV